MQTAHSLFSFKTFKVSFSVRNRLGTIMIFALFNKGLSITYLRKVFSKISFVFICDK